MTELRKNYIIDESTGTSANVMSVNGYDGLVSIFPAHVCTDNSTTSTLSGGASFTGSFEDALNFGVICITVYADVASDDDGLEVQFSTDGINVDAVDYMTIPAATGKTFTFQTAARYFRIKYTNGVAAQSAFRLQTVLKPYYIKPSSHRIADSISSQDDAELIKAVISGKKPDGEFTNVQTTTQGNLKISTEEFGDTPSIDPFGRLRVSNPYTLFDSKQLYDDQPLIWDESTGGSATSSHSTTDARTQLSVTASASDYAIRQTKMRFNYQPGKGQLIFLTGLLEKAAGVTKRAGIFTGTSTNNMTPDDGIFYQASGTSLSWNIAKNGTTTETATQANWNKDTLDGSGDENNPSGINIDDGTVQILTIDYEWLGVGRVRVGFVIDGLFHVVHEFNHANTSGETAVYMSTPNLPIRYDIHSDGAGAGTLDHICSSVISEGGREDNGIIRYQSTSGTHIDANTENTIYAVIGIRLKSTHLGACIKPINTTLIESVGSNHYEWLLLLNPTVAGTFTYSGETNSAVEIATGATANTVTGGYKLAGGFNSSSFLGGGGTSDVLNTALRLGSNIDGTVDELVLCVRPVAGSTNINVEGSISWRELL